MRRSADEDSDRRGREAKTGLLPEGEIRFCYAIEEMSVSVGEVNEGYDRRVYLQQRGFGRPRPGERRRAHVSLGTKTEGSEDGNGYIGGRRRESERRRSSNGFVCGEAPAWTGPSGQQNKNESMRNMTHSVVGGHSFGDNADQVQMPVRHLIPQNASYWISSHVRVLNVYKMNMHREVVTRQKKRRRRSNKGSREQSYLDWSIGAPILPS